MSQFISILLSPYHFFFGENGLWGSAALGQREKDNTQQLYYGIPSLLFAILGLLFLIVGELNAGKSLIQKYEDEIANITAAQADLAKDFEQELEKTKSTNTGAEVASEKLNEIGGQLIKKLDSKEIYLSKLNSLAPDQPQYLYQIALTLFSKSKLSVASSGGQAKNSSAYKNQGLSIMNQIAPLAKPGFLDAHLFLAQHALASKIHTARDGAENLRIANTHLDNALIRDQDSVDALRLKALLAQKSGDLEEAKDFLLKLFAKDPFLYPQICQVNGQLNLKDENHIVLHNARVRLSEELNQMTGFSNRRTKYATYLVDCLHRLENVDSADKVIAGELEKFQDNKTVLRWGLRLLAIGQELRYRNSEKINAGNMQELVGYLQKGYQFDPNNEKILQHIVSLYVTNIPNVAKTAKAIYQPGVNAPASIENLLGAFALSNGDYVEALKRFLKATQKAPRNANYLNNLSFLYLTRPEPNPQEALKLVDRAIASQRSAGVSARHLTHFYDTKGRALLALGKIAEEKGEKNLASSRFAAATAFFLKALADRPNDLKIIQGVIECYKADGRSKQVKVWVERAEQLRPVVDK